MRLLLPLSWWPMPILLLPVLSRLMAVLPMLPVASKLVAAWRAVPRQAALPSPARRLALLVTVALGPALLLGAALSVASAVPLSS